MSITTITFAFLATFGLVPQRRQVLPEPAFKKPAYVTRFPEADVREISVSVTEPATDVFEEITQMLLMLPLAKQRKLARLLRHGYGIGMPVAIVPNNVVQWKMAA